MTSRLVRHLVCILFTLVTSTSSLAAATVDVAVYDRSGKPVADVIVMAESKTQNPLALTTNAHSHFQMDQKNLAFDPYILVVPAGSSVRFLNSDTTAHHVYSFSKTKRFTLPLHKSQVPDPVIFDTTGVVTLGCNIHDEMVGYIVVAESDLYTTTDSRGLARLTVSNNVEDVQLRIWSPRIRDKGKLLIRDAATGAPVRFTLKRKLKPVYRPTEYSEWNDY